MYLVIEGDESVLQLLFNYHYWFLYGSPKQDKEVGFIIKPRR